MSERWNKSFSLEKFLNAHFCSVTARTPTTERLLRSLSSIVEVTSSDIDGRKSLNIIQSLINHQGGHEKVISECNSAISLNTNNHLPFVTKFYKSHRSTLFRLVKALQMGSTTKDSSILDAIDFLLLNQKKKAMRLPYTGSLSFLDQNWKKIIIESNVDEKYINRRHFEACVFTMLVHDLKSGDIFVDGSEQYADYRDQLLSWDDCLALLPKYLEEVNLPNSAKCFCKNLRDTLALKIEEADQNYKNQTSYTIDDSGVPSVTKLAKREIQENVRKQQELIMDNMPERHLIEILCNTQHWLNWTRHFGPAWGSDPKIENPKERYIITAFAYGSNLGPNQAAKHFRKPLSPFALSFANKKHTTIEKLDNAIKDHINQYSKLDLPKAWGSGKSSAADGTKYDVYEQNLLAEYHIRYGGYGGIAYHHIADNYIALFTHFIPCGTWEAIYILEGLLKNDSDVQPDTIFSDTQGQSAPVFAFAYLLGIKLMPRIRNFKGLNFFRASKGVRYKHLDELFNKIVDWEKIESRWEDIMRVILSVRAGKISSPMILRKLGNYSRKNDLYIAFRELGQVVRTIFLLSYLTDSELRGTIDAETNKVESFHQFSDWMSFGGDDTIRENDPEQQEKIVKYNHLLANAVILQNTSDLSNVINNLKRKEGITIDLNAVMGMSPYMTKNIKRFGYFDVDLEALPPKLVSKVPVFH